MIIFFWKNGLVKNLLKELNETLNIKRNKNKYNEKFEKVIVSKKNHFPFEIILKKIKKKIY